MKRRPNSRARQDGVIIGRGPADARLGSPACERWVVFWQCMALPHSVNKIQFCVEISSRNHIQGQTSLYNSFTINTLRWCTGWSFACYNSSRDQCRVSQV